jgi:hypothetical protein
LKKLEIEESKIIKMTQISAPIQNSITVVSPVQNSISGVSGQLLAEIIKLIGEMFKSSLFSSSDTN